MSDLRGLASAIMRSVEPDDVPSFAVGIVRQVQLSGSDGEAQVQFGFSPDLIPIGSANWGEPFVSEVRTNPYVLVGCRVFAVFPDGQPTILMTMGVV